MRVTTNMIMRNYQSSLSSTLQRQEGARRQVESGRRFSHAYEDPTAAANAAILERRDSRNSDYLNTVKSVQKWQDQQEAALGQLSEAGKKVVGDYTIGAITGTAGEDGRGAYVAALRDMQRSMVSSLNSKFGETFVMAGADGGKAPFELSADGKILTYRGIDVNDPANQAVLDELSKETTYVDVGFGLTFDAAGEIVSSSAFNSALPGINAVGYGKTADGTTKNLVLLAGELADELEKEPVDEAAYRKLWDQFSKGNSNLQNQFTSIGTKDIMLKTTEANLESEKVAIQDQYNLAVGIEPSEAITNYSWAMYAYNTALKVGTSILSPSLLDFMK